MRAMSTIRLFDTPLVLEGPPKADITIHSHDVGVSWRSVLPPMHPSVFGGNYKKRTA